MILVTGSSGFIGREIVNTLKRRNIEHKVLGGDITDPKTYSILSHNFNIIIHCAAIISHKGLDKDNKLLNKVNVEGTKTLLIFFSKAKMIYISTKDVTRNVLSDYAKTKLISEILVLNKSKKNAVIRLPSIFGPDSKQKKLIPLLIDETINNVPCIITNDDEREYLYIQDCANQIIDNLNSHGIVTLHGIKIRNFEIKKLIQSICHEDTTKYYALKYELLFQQLSKTIHLQHPEYFIAKK